MADPYGVLKGRVVEGRRPEPHVDGHYRIHMVDDQEVHYRVSVNVKAVQIGLEDLLCQVMDPFEADSTRRLHELPAEFTDLEGADGQSHPLAFDYVRDRLVSQAELRPLGTDELCDVIEKYVELVKAQQDGGARIYTFGRRFGPDRGRPDDWFGFEPVDGVHEVHMNQGGFVPYEGANAAGEDGVLIFELEDRWVAIFLAFQVQCWDTQADGSPAADCTLPFTLGLVPVGTSPPIPVKKW
jgi:uncharacterized protein YukJ